MKIAVASDGLNVAQSFARCQNFNYYTTRSYEIAETQNIPAQGLTPEQYAKFMRTVGVDALIAGSISPNARDAFETQHIQVVQDVQGGAFQAASNFVAECAASLEANAFEDED